ncbi:MAG: hypothetical protein KF760_23410 [Candidatus Eremiobacteraeota bacterium]|nr:hypothetical protein [Candidatus Eremiobacteraeota bacterium]MCW5866173.1 hypothetical protein [Candidatus Eremiobacteraeota bacterium]
MQELNPSARFSVRDLMRPGCLVGLTGLLIIAFAVFRLAWGASTPDDGLEIASSGKAVKQMVWLVTGVGLTLFGALLSYVEYKRR